MPTTTFLPKYEFPVIEPTSLELDCLLMERLGTISNIEEFSAELKPLADVYEKWITTQLRPKIDTLEPKLQRTATEQAKRCEDALRRIREGIEIVSSDQTAGDSFRFANLAMHFQRLYGVWAQNNRKSGRVNGYGPKKPEKPPRWYPFQLAFILSTIKSSVLREDKDREDVELIFFPTGGGKTEAYLGLSAFTSFYKRLVDPNDDGVNVIMRYTLRLLTAQQFTRASSLICAMEKIRERHEEDLGKSEFSIGVWVGSASTPNKMKGSARFPGAMEFYNKLIRGTRDDSYKFLITKIDTKRMAPDIFRVFLSISFKKSTEIYGDILFIKLSTSIINIAKTGIEPMPITSKRVANKLANIIK